MGLFYILMTNIGASYGLIIGATLFIFSVVCGVLILTDNQMGFTFTMINQLLQIVNLSILGVHYVYYNPASFEIGYSSEVGVLFDLHIGSKFIINFNDGVFDLLSFNVIAAFIVYRMLRIRSTLTVVNIGSNRHGC